MDRKTLQSPVDGGNFVSTRKLAVDRVRDALPRLRVLLVLLAHLQRSERCHTLKLRDAPLSNLPRHPHEADEYRLWGTPSVPRSCKYDEVGWLEPSRI